MGTRPAPIFQRAEEEINLLAYSKEFYHRNDFVTAIGIKPECSGISVRKGGLMLEESFLIKGYRKVHICDNDPSLAEELLIITTEIDVFPDDVTIRNFLKVPELSRCEVVKTYRAI